MILSTFYQSCISAERLALFDQMKRGVARWRAPIQSLRIFWIVQHILEGFERHSTHDMRLTHRIYIRRYPAGASAYCLPSNLAHQVRGCPPTRFAAANSISFNSAWVRAPAVSIFRINLSNRAARKWILPSSEPVSWPSVFTSLRGSSIDCACLARRSASVIRHARCGRKLNPGVLCRCKTNDFGRQALDRCKTPSPTLIG